MSTKTGIEWTDATWNPVTGCWPVSAGCANCYAASVARRFSQPGQPYEGLAERRDGKDRWTGKVVAVFKHLDDPLRWMEPRKIFVNSMSDLFHEDVPEAYIAAVFGVMAMACHHTYQILTKRPERMMDVVSRLNIDNILDAIIAAGVEVPVAKSKAITALLPPDSPFRPESAAPIWPLPNVWLGVSVENQATAIERIPLLLHTPAKVRFLSCEPLLGPVDLTDWTRIAWQCSGCQHFFPNPYKLICPVCKRDRFWSGSHKFNPKGGQVGSGIDWVICGGESGPNARPMHPDWARSLRDQCGEAGVPFHFKQWGGWKPNYDRSLEDPWWDTPEAAEANRRGIFLNLDGKQECEGPRVVRMDKIGKVDAGHVLDGVEHREFPEVTP